MCVCVCVCYIYYISYTCITESLCCIPETNTTLYINSTSILKNKNKIYCQKKKRFYQKSQSPQSLHLYNNASEVPSSVDWMWFDSDKPFLFGQTHRNMASAPSCRVMGWAGRSRSSVPREPVPGTSACCPAPQARQASPHHLPCAGQKDGPADSPSPASTLHSPGSALQDLP